MICLPRGWVFKPGLPRTRTACLGVGRSWGKRSAVRSQICTHFPGGDFGADCTSSSLIPASLLLPRARPGGLQLPMSGDLTPGESVFHVRERGAEEELGAGRKNRGGGGGRCEEPARGEVGSRADN